MAALTWTQTAVTAATDNIAVDATGPRIVYAASARGLFSQHRRRNDLVYFAGHQTERNDPGDRSQ
jgi:hypothetical protein